MHHVVLSSCVLVRLSSEGDALWTRVLVLPALSLFCPRRHECHQKMSLPITEDSHFCPFGDLNSQLSHLTGSVCLVSYCSCLMFSGLRQHLPSPFMAKKKGLT